MDWDIIKFGFYRFICVIYVKIIDYCFNVILKEKFLLVYGRIK